MKALFPLVVTLMLTSTWAVSAQAVDQGKLPPAKSEIEPSSKAKGAVRSSGVNKTVDAQKQNAGSGAESVRDKAVKVRQQAADQKVPQPVSVEGLKEHPATKNAD